MLTEQRDTTAAAAAAAAAAGVTGEPDSDRREKRETF